MYIDIHIEGLIAAITFSDTPKVRIAATVQCAALTGSPQYVAINTLSLE